MIRRGLPRLAACALAAMPLSGCAAALVPVVAGGVIAREGLRKGPEAARATEAVTGAPVGLAEPAASPAAAPAMQARAGEVWAVADSTALPPPSAPQAAPPTVDGADPADPYGAFTRFALATAASHAAAPERRQSALLDQATIADIAPSTLPCGSQPPAVAIDLDPGEKPFDVNDPPLPAPGLANHLASLRAAGITIAWIAGVEAAAAEQVYTVLQASGLDPDRTDRLLLLTKGLSRKQLRRDAAGRDWCVLAVAGDKRGDFDEVFDYLRDSQGTLARALETRIGSGWFLAPPPID